MIPPLARQLRTEDFASPDEAVAALVSAFNYFQQEVINCLSSGISDDNLARTVRSVSFTTDDAGKASVRVKHGLSGPAQLVTLGRIGRQSGQPLGAEWGWAMEWVNYGASEVLLSFVDMPLSVVTVATVVME